MNRSVGAVALLLCLGLAGCTKDPTDVVVVDECEDLALCDLDEFLQDHYCVKNNKSRTYAPDVEDERGSSDPWVKGDWWQYDLSMSGQSAGSTRLVYYDIQDNGAHYMVGTPTREEALDHAVHSTNPVIGRVHKTLYSPHESGSHADMFNFPLCAGNSWTDTFFATQFTFTVTQGPLTLPDGTVDRDAYAIRGTAEDGSTVTHSYSPIVKWFTRIDLERADGTSIDMELTQFGASARGEAFFLRGQQDETLNFPRSAQQEELQFDRADGNMGPYEALGVQLDLSRTGSGKVELHLLDPDQEVVACVGLAGSEVGGDTECLAPGALLEVPWKPGTWTARLSPALLGAEASATVAVASIYDRSGRV